MRSRGFAGSRRACVYTLAPLAILLCGIPIAVTFADEMEHDAAYLPDLGGNLLSVHNPLGSVVMRGWDQRQIRIVAEKRANSPAILERLRVQFVLLQDGRVQISAGFHLADHTFIPLPLSGAGIDLIIDAPRRMRLEATTSGAIEASGFQHGAQLSSQGGEIRVVDLQGPVDTHTLDGRQWLQSITGSLLATGVTGDVELRGVHGDVVDASVFKGNIFARDVVGADVKMRTVIGTIVFLGALPAGGRYQFATQSGDVKLALRPSPFRLVARAPTVRNAFALGHAEARPGLVRGDYAVGGPALELVAAQGEVHLGPAIDAR